MSTYYHFMSFSMFNITITRASSRSRRPRNRLLRVAPHVTSGLTALSNGRPPQLQLKGVRTRQLPPAVHTPIGQLTLTPARAPRIEPSAWRGGVMAHRAQRKAQTVTRATTTATPLRARPSLLTRPRQSHLIQEQVCNNTLTHLSTTSQHVQL